MFPDKKQARWRFEMRDETNPGVKLGSEMELNVVELKKSARLAAEQGTPDPSEARLWAWIMFFNHWKDPDIMNQIDHPPVLEAMRELKRLSAVDENQRIAELRERILITEFMEIEDALARGKAEGLAEGKAEGKAEGMAAALRAMVASGISESQARSILGL